MNEIQKIRKLLDRALEFLDALDETKVRFAWDCPHCKKTNKWTWDKEDFSPRGTWPMLCECEHCGKESKQKKPRVIV